MISSFLFHYGIAYTVNNLCNRQNFASAFILLRHFLTRLVNWLFSNQ